MGLTTSTIIPTYNVAPFLARTIQSVLDQTRESSEIIVVDDCSTDGTIAVARSFDNTRVKVLSTPINSGSAVARNIGIRAATGELIAMLDGDDYWLEEHLACVGGLLDKHPSAVIAFSSTEAFGAQSWVWPIRIATDQPVNCFWDCLPRTLIPHMNVVARRLALLDIGGYDKSLRQSQDYDLFLRLSHRYPFICTRQITTMYRRHQGSITLMQPLNSLHCMYRSRFNFGQSMAKTATAAELDKFLAIGLRIWEAALRQSVFLSDWAMMDFHLEQSRYVPGSEAALLRWRLRRAAGTVQQFWDFANRPVRNPFKTSDKVAA